MLFKLVTNEKMLNAALNIRKKVFVDEQKMPISEEINQNESEYTHFLVYAKKNKPIATCRIKEYDILSVKIQRVCILKEYRGAGIGRLLMTFVEQTARRSGYTKARLDAQISAIHFYYKLGYQIISDVFLDGNMEHRTMEKSL